MNQWTKEQLEEMFGNNRFDQLVFLSGCQKHRLANDKTIPDGWVISDEVLKKFAQLIVQECAAKIETYRIPVGNSAAGEMACELTHAALKEIRDDIKETFGVE